MYKLLYIKGISHFDTIRFDSLADQTAYMNNHAVHTVDDYFPPHYTNRIKLTTTDVPLTSRVNYLSLSFAGKNYYYFISGIEYINEDVYYIDIEMDDIQSYMFDFTVISTDIDRMSIKRWTGTDTPIYINRDYIRENLSRGVFKNRLYSVESTMPFAIVVASRAIYRNQVDYTTTKQYTSQNTEVDTGLYYYLVPLVSFVGTSGVVNIKNPSGTTTYATINVLNDDNFNFIHLCMSNPNVVNIFYINLNTNLLYYNFNDSTYVLNIFLNTNSTSWCKMFGIDTTYPFAELDDSGTWKSYPAIHIWATDYEKVDSSWFYIPDIGPANRETGVSFSASYVPQLIDENYYSVKYGERAKLTEYKLSLAIDTQLRKYHYIDINTSYRVYKLTDRNDTNDVYLNTITIDNQTNIPLLTDPWEQYTANNKNWKNLLVLKYGMMAFNGINNFAGDYENAMSKGIAMAESNPDITNISWKPSKREMLKVGTNIAAATQVDMYRRDNLQNAPIGVSISDSYYTDKLSKAIDTVTIINRVVDYEEVAMKLEYYGYKVNKTIYNVNNIFDYFNYRYYYNVLKTANAKITGKILLSNEQIIRIESRLNDGLRIWNRIGTFEIGDALSYDNIETDFIDEEEEDDN